MVLLQCCFAFGVQKYEFHSSIFALKYKFLFTQYWAQKEGEVG